MRTSGPRVHGLAPLLPLLLLATTAGLLLTASACASAGAGERAPWEGPVTAQSLAVEKALDHALRHTGTASVAVAYLDIATGSRVLHYETQQFHAASTMKVPVMIAAWAAIDAGELAPDQPLPVRNEFRSIVDGSRYHLAAADDGDPELYAAIGGTRPVSELIRRMIVRSSNLATNLLIDRLTASRVTELMRQMGAYSIQILRGVEDEKAYQAGFNNEVTAADLMLLLGAIAQAAAAPETAAQPLDTASSSAPSAAATISHRAATAMVGVLEGQEFNEKIPAGLPPGTPVAHKTGDIVGVHHDAAIVYPPGGSPYVLVVLTQGFLKEDEANRFIANVSKEVWQARQAPPPPPPARGHAKPTGKV
jgi:beta-lactamase class A